MHENAKCVCFIYMQPQKLKFKSVQINMKQVSYSTQSKKYFSPAFMQIRCSFPDISNLGETQKNNFQFLNKNMRES